MNTITMNVFLLTSYLSNPFHGNPVGIGTYMSLYLPYHSYCNFGDNLRIKTKLM